MTPLNGGTAMTRTAFDKGGGAQARGMSYGGVLYIESSIGVEKRNNVMQFYR